MKWTLFSSYKTHVIEKQSEIVFNTYLYEKAQPCDKWSFTSAYSVIRKPIHNSIHSAS